MKIGHLVILNAVQDIEDIQGQDYENRSSLFESQELKVPPLYYQIYPSPADPISGLLPMTKAFISCENQISIEIHLQSRCPIKRNGREGLVDKMKSKRCPNAFDLVQKWWK